MLVIICREAPHHWCTRVHVSGNSISVGCQGMLCLSLVFPQWVSLLKNKLGNVGIVQDNQSRPPRRDKRLAYLKCAQCLN
jgi:hypothetical protein